MESNVAPTETCPCCGQERPGVATEASLLGPGNAEPAHSYTGVRGRIADFLADQDRASSILVGIPFALMVIISLMSFTAYFVLR